jgi:uncharacterized damage-inducible protein DinB
MTAEEARNHIRYSTWASRRLLHAALQLDAEHQHRDMSVSHKSVHATLGHILFADRIWLSRLLNQTIEPEGTLEIEWPRIRERWEALADAWNDADLERVITYKVSSGKEFSSTLREIVLHVVNHATLHRGQVMGMFRQLGIAPPPTDLIFFFREQQSAHA